MVTKRKDKKKSQDIHKTKKQVQRKGKKKKKKSNFLKAVQLVAKLLRRINPGTVGDAIRAALNCVKSEVVKKDVVKTPRIVPIPKTGGILPLIPIFAGLSALGALGGGAAGIAKAVGDAKAAREQLQEAQRHNRTMESIAIGRGLYLRPYKKGLGLYLKPYHEQGL